MDTETAEAVETLRSDIHRVEHEVVRVETSLTARIEHVETSLTARIEHVETSLTAKIEQVDDIRLLAEGFASLSVEVRSLRR